MATSKTKRGRRSKPLSEVAEHVVLPVGITTTGWPAVREQCRSFGIEFDSWQDGVGRGALAKRENGLYAAGVGGVVLSVPRQVGKTFLVGAVAFALCMLTPKTKVIWTAHHTTTADETFADMRDLALKQKIAPHIDRVLTGMGKQIIVFRNGSRIEFGSRESGFGRGKTKVNVLVLDEAQILSEKALDNLLPTLNQAPNPIYFLMGTPPKPEDPGWVFANRRQRAIEGKSQDTFYVEFSADVDAKLDSRTQWRKANPSFPDRTPEDAILRMREGLSDDSFRREALGIWDRKTAGKPTVDIDHWGLLHIPDSDAPQGRMAVGVKFSPDGEYSALSIAIRPDDRDVPIHVAPIRMASSSEGIGWIVEWVRARKDKVTQVVVDGKQWAPILIDALQHEGLRAKRGIKKETSQPVRQFGVGDIIAAHTAFLDAITGENLTHGDSPTLDAQIADATQRKIGTQGGWGWQPLSDTGTTALLDATTLAFYAAKTVTRGTRGGVTVS